MRPKRYVVLQKPVGITPLAAVDRWRAAHPAYRELRASYAGRLDPMASGKLLVLLGDECRNQSAYIGLDKEYEIEVLFDITTDTGDVLGMPLHDGQDTFPRQADLKRALRDVRGTHEVPYPAYSSKTVAGKPLFLYALEGTLDSIKIPTHAETIYRIRPRALTSISKKKLSARVRDTLALAPRTDEASKALGADFRQDRIREAWEALWAQLPECNFTLLRLRVVCGSGTYMRTLAPRIAAALGTTGLALSIHRTYIGTYRSVGPFGLWTKRFT